MGIYYQDDTIKLLHGDALDEANLLPDGCVDCIVTSPPYFGLRDYGSGGQYGLEESPAAYVETMRVLFSELRRVLADDGTLWLNIGDSYGRGSRPISQPPQGFEKDRTGSRRPQDDGRSLNLPAKNLLGVPWRTAFALQDDGWNLRNAIVWHKPNAKPESVTDRISSTHENVFMFTKSTKYWFDLDAVRIPLSITRSASRKARRPRDGWKENSAPGAYSGGSDKGKNPGDVWHISTQPFPGAHFATMPTELARRCIVAGCKPGGTVLDPFSGSGTTGLAAVMNGRKYVGVDINAEYLKLSLETRLQTGVLELDGV